MRLIRPERSTGAPAAGRTRTGLLYPLDVVYARAGLPTPRAAEVGDGDLPLPYRSLLVHQRDMTVVLEQHFGGRISLRPLSVFVQGSWYYRRVLLVQEYSGRPVEMGAIRVNLSAFPPRVRQQVLRGEVPLGRVLRDGGVDYLSRPRRFLRVTPNSEMMGVFWMREPKPLYGRQTEVIVGASKIGDIVEILPLTW